MRFGVSGKGGVGKRAASVAFAAEHDIDLLAVIPRDESVVAADRLGACVLDTAPGSAAVAAIAALGERIQKVA